MSPNHPRIAVVGGGPIGLEAALYARALGYPTRLFEARELAHHIRSWGHVRLFTPWSLNLSPLAVRRLEAEGGWTAPDPDVLPTGHDLVERYLEPLSRLPEMKDVISEHREVIALGRGQILKGHHIGSDKRGEQAFRILLHDAAEEGVEEADVVIDATGVYGQPNALGAGGIPAPGERALADRISVGLPDVAGADRSRFEGRRVLVVGGGLSAATTVRALAQLPGVVIEWATLGGSPPLAPVTEDTLPTRATLIEEANALVEEGVHHHPLSVVLGLREDGDAIRVTLRSPNGEEDVVVDHIVNQTGFRPDRALHRELQVHECYASEGTMNLAAALLGSEGGDCMAQAGFGPKSLVNPEPNFFVIGHKSYGRNSEFLLRIGREQVRDVFRLVSGDSELDLYAESSPGV